MQNFAVVNVTTNTGKITAGVNIRHVQCVEKNFSNLIQVQNFAVLNAGLNQLRGKYYVHVTTAALSFIGNCRTWKRTEDITVLPNVERMECGGAMRT